MDLFRAEVTFLHEKKKKKKKTPIWWRIPTFGHIQTSDAQIIPSMMDVIFDALHYVFWTQ